MRYITSSQLLILEEVKNSSLTTGISIKHRPDKASTECVSCNFGSPRNCIHFLHITSRETLHKLAGVSFDPKITGSRNTDERRRRCLLVFFYKFCLILRTLCLNDVGTVWMPFSPFRSSSERIGSYEDLAIVSHKFFVLQYLPFR